MQTKGGQDLVAGVMFAAIGIAAYVIGADYNMGTPQKPGTGVLPRILACALIGCGGVLAIKAFVTDLAGMAQAIWRPLAIAVVALALGGAVQWYSTKYHPAFEGTPVVQMMIGLIALFFIAGAFGIDIAWGGTTEAGPPGMRTVAERRYRADRQVRVKQHPPYRRCRRQVGHVVAICPRAPAVVGDGLGEAQYATCIRIPADLRICLEGCQCNSCGNHNIP